MKTINESLSLNFRTTVVLPSIFELENLSYVNQGLKKLINDTVTGDLPEVDPDSKIHIFQKLHLMVLYSSETKIPER